MAFVCDTCKPLEGHQYWHDRLIKQQFFKIMLDFERRLRIPPKFIDCFKGHISRQCTLRVQSGNIWEVEITKENHDFFFSKGWAKFVRDHSIEKCDFLVFQYAGDSAFEVSIFDKSGCETEGSYFRKNMKNSETSCRSLLHSENNESETAKDSDVSADEISADKMYDREFKNIIPSHQKNHEIIPSHSSHNDRGGNKGKQIQMYFVSNRRKVYLREKKDAVNKADSFIAKRSKKSSRPMVKIVMLQSHVSKGFHLTIPTKWATTHMFRDSHEVNLQVSGIQDSWKVGCRWSSTQCQLIRGWPAFVLANNLEVGDVCVFELVEKGNLDQEINCVIKVYIFRVVEDVVPPTVERGY